MINLSVLRRMAARVAPIAVVAILLLQSPAAHAVPFLYATDRSVGRVNSVQSDGTFSQFAKGGLMSNVEGIAIDASGNVYVADSPNNSNDKVVKITPSGTVTSFAAFGTHVSPTGLVFDSDGNLFVATQTENSIRKITPGGTISTYSSSTLLNRPFGLAFDGFGNLFAACHGNNTIVKFDSSGSASVFANLSTSNPNGLAFNTSGDLFVSYNSSGQIDRLTRDGSITTFYSGSSFSQAMGLAVDPSDNVYVASNNPSYRIFRIDPSGSSATLFTNMTNMSSSLEFLALSSAAIPVPEPSTYIMALLGLGVTGYAMGRRRSYVAIVGERSAL
jgi:sugar lactone lactonase YvrE